MTVFFKLDGKCAFYPYEGSSHSEEFLLRTAAGRQFQLSPLAKEILESLDGNTSLETIAARLQSRNIPISADHLHSFLEEQYGTLGIFEGYTAAQPAPEPSQQERKSPLPIFLHWRLLPARYVAWIARRLHPLFNRFVVWGGILSIAAAHYWLYRRELPDLFSDGPPTINILLATGLALCSILIHEFGHASAVARYGGSPGPIGLGLFILMPSFYADVSEIWRFPRRQRMVVDSGGVYFQQLVFCVFAVCCYFTGMPEFAIVCTVIDTMALLTMNPVFQFDGYWLLVDYLGLPELQRLAWRELGRWLLRFKNVPALPPLRRHGRLVFVLYAVGCIAFVAILVRMEYHYLLVPSGQFLAILPKLVRNLLALLKAGKLLQVVNYLLAIVFLFAIPLSTLIGLASYGTRIYQRIARRIRPAVSHNV